MRMYPQKAFNDGIWSLRGYLYLMMEFGHSEGTFTQKKFLVYLVKVPLELRNCRNLTRQSRFVVYSRTLERKAVNDGIWPF